MESRRKALGASLLWLVVVAVVLSSDLLVAAPAATAADGTPQIKNVKWPNMCLDADPGEDFNGGRVYLWECVGGAPQSWFAVHDGGGNYTIHSNLDGRCLDADPGNPGNGSRVYRWDCNGTDQQLWRDGGGGRLRNVLTGLCLDADVAAPNAGANRTPVQMYACLGWENGTWRIDPEVICGVGDDQPGCPEPPRNAAPAPAPLAPPAPPSAPSATARDEGCRTSPASSSRRLRARARPRSTRRRDGRRRGRRVTVGFGRKAVVKGRLTDADGRPVAGAGLCVMVKRGASSARRHRSRRVSTGRRGRFRYAVPRGPSRRIWVVHRAGGASAVATVVVRVRAGVTLRASPRRVDAGRTVTLAGKIKGGRRPRGVLVALQARDGDGWQTFGHARANGKGRYRYRYTFTRTYSTRSYRLRARVLAQRGYPFAPGSSKPVRVKVRG